MQFSLSAAKAVLVGSGALGKEVIIVSRRLGVEIMPWIAIQMCRAIVGYQATGLMLMISIADTCFAENCGAVMAACYRTED